MSRHKIVPVLLECGADPNYPLAEEETVWRILLSRSLPDLTDFLLRHDLLGFILDFMRDVADMSVSYRFRMSVVDHRSRGWRFKLDAAFNDTGEIQSGEEMVDFIASELFKLHLLNEDTDVTKFFPSNAEVRDIPQSIVDWLQRNGEDPNKCFRITPKRRYRNSSWPGVMARWGRHKAFLEL
jgi:hypothetical protein